MAKYWHFLIKSVFLLIFAFWLRKMQNFRVIRQHGQMSTGFIFFYCQFIPDGFDEYDHQDNHDQNNGNERKKVTLHITDGIV